MATSIALVRRPARSLADDCQLTFLERIPIMLALTTAGATYS